MLHLLFCNLLFTSIQQIQFLKKLAADLISELPRGAQRTLILPFANV